MKKETYFDILNLADKIQDDIFVSFNYEGNKFSFEKIYIEDYDVDQKIEKWSKNNKTHCEHGPAEIITNFGKKKVVKWFLEGKQIDDKDFKIAQLKKEIDSLKKEIDKLKNYGPCVENDEYLRILALLKKEEDKT